MTKIAFFRHGGETSAIPYARRRSFTHRGFRIKFGMTIKDYDSHSHPIIYSSLPINSSNEAFATMKL